MSSRLVAALRQIAVKAMPYQVHAPGVVEKRFTLLVYVCPDFGAKSTTS